MDGFYEPEMSTRAAHALALANRRGHEHTRAGLTTLARQILAQAKPLALENPDELLMEAWKDATSDLWDSADYGTGHQDQAGEITDVHIDQATVDHAMNLLDTTTGPSTPGDADDAAQELGLILLGVLHALNLTCDIEPTAAARELSDGQWALPTPAPRSEAKPTPSPGAFTDEPPF